MKPPQGKKPQQASHSRSSQEPRSTQGTEQAHTPSWLPGPLAAACPGASVSALRPLEDTFHSAASGILLKLEFYQNARMMNPSVTPQLSESAFLHPFSNSWAP